MSYNKQLDELVARLESLVYGGYKPEDESKVWSGRIGPIQGSLEVLLKGVEETVMSEEYLHIIRELANVKGMKGEVVWEDYSLDFVTSNGYYDLTINFHVARGEVIEED